MIAKDDDGYSKHLDRISYQWAVWENRPVPCRAFDCRKDKLIWLDFKRNIINPDLKKLFKKGNGKPLESLGLIDVMAKGSSK